MASASEALRIDVEAIHLQERLRIPVELAGKPLDFTEAGLRIPVVHARVASLFAELAPDDVRYPIMYELRIDKAKVGSAKALRCEGWEGPLIVSGEIKDALEHMGATGTRFEAV